MSLARVAQLLLIYPKEEIRGMSKDLHVEMFTIALFRIYMDMDISSHRVQFKLI